MPNHSGRSTAALAYVGMTAASAVAYLVIDHRFDDKYADYQRVKTAYDASTSDEERQDLWSRLQTTQRDAYDAEDFRRAAITVTAALYAANVLDALIFMPRRANTPDAKGLTLTPGSGHNAAGATLSYRF